jgi:Raf kinase inhibitor-like YbhB/YbcL family protein
MSWLLTVSLAACISVALTDAGRCRTMEMKILSAAFSGGSEIPRRYTCDGDDISPPLSWEGLPEGTESLVLIVEDPDAPDPKAPKMIWIHWALYNIPPSAGGVPEGGELPPGTKEGINSWNRTGYGGPCPPIGRHRYFHRLYALDKELAGQDRPDRAELLAAMKGHVLAQAELVGTYQR